VSAFIDAHRERFGVEPTCRTLGVSASAYYHRATGRRSARRVEDERLLGVIEDVHGESYCAYGSRRMWKALNRSGEHVGRSRVERLMRQNGIQGAKRRGKPWRTTKSDPTALRAPDLRSAAARPSPSAKRHATGLGPYCAPRIPLTVATPSSAFSSTDASVSPPPGWTSIGDAESDVLANGTFMLAQPCQESASTSGTLTTDDALFNASGLSWTVIPGQGKNDPNDEEGWTLEPSGQLLTVDTWLTPTTELFNPTNLTWGFAGNTFTSPVNSPEVEIGPQVEMPGGNTFVVGAGTRSQEPPEECTTHKPAATALYDYATGKWSNGPSIPTIEGLQCDSGDGPGSILPDGNVLFDVSPCVYSSPLAVYLYNAASNTLSAVPNAANDSTYYTRMLALPNGQVLFNDGSDQMELYTAGGTPNPAWAPSISSISSSTITPGRTASLSGTQLAGLDQGAAYGDDVQDATNFPLVRITNTQSGIVTYARTSNWTSVSVAPGTRSSTDFTVPKGTPAGPSTLVAGANGIASEPVPITIRRAKRAARCGRRTRATP